MLRAIRSAQRAERVRAFVLARGGKVLVQDPATAESPVMPAAAIAATEVDAVLSLEAMGSVLTRLHSLPAPSQ